jgi:hypothetical protein
MLTIDVREYDLFADPSGATEEISARVRQRLERELPQTELWPPSPHRPAFELTTG